jgi:hypothetical protein
MLRNVLVLAAFTLTGGCLTFGGGKSRMVELVTEPAGALARVEGFGECETPCTIELDAPRMVTLAKAGYTAKRFQLTTEKKKVEVVMELAAPTTEVDTTVLPEIK